MWVGARRLSQTCKVQKSRPMSPGAVWGRGAGERRGEKRSETGGTAWAQARRAMLSGSSKACWRRPGDAVQSAAGRMRTEGAARLGGAGLARWSMRPCALIGAVVAVPVVPRGLWAPLRPQPCAVAARLVLQWRQMGVCLGIGDIDPGQARPHLCAGHIGAATAHVGHGAPIAVGLQRLQRGALPETQVCQVLARLLAKRLARLGLRVSFDGGVNNSKLRIYGQKSIVQFNSV